MHKIQTPLQSSELSPEPYLNCGTVRGEGEEEKEEGKKKGREGEKERDGGERKGRKRGRAGKGQGVGVWGFSLPYLRGVIRHGIDTRR